MNLPKNLPAGLFKKAAKHIKNAEQSILTGLFSHDVNENIIKVEDKFESIKKSN